MDSEYFRHAFMQILLQCTNDSNQAQQPRDNLQLVNDNFVPLLVKAFSDLNPDELNEIIQIVMDASKCFSL